MNLDFDTCYRAVSSRDQRFDGYFFTAVRTTGIYCRPSCPATTPQSANVEFHPSAAAAQRAGFRACKRCRPDATPGSPEWNSRNDVVGRAMRLIIDGYVDRHGVSGLAQALSYSERQLNRVLLAELGAGPLSIARARRAQTARILIETTDLAQSAVAFAAGFSSIRQFNDTVGAVFATTPTQLRAAARGRKGAIRRDQSLLGPDLGHAGAKAEPGATAPPGGTIRVRLAYRRPCDLGSSLAFLSERAVPGLEWGDGKRFMRSLSLSHGWAIMAVGVDGASGDSATGTAGEITPGGANAGRYVDASFQLQDFRDLTEAVQAARRMLDLDADPMTVSEQLGADPVIGALVQAHPGRRVPGHPDGAELAIRAILGQQVSVAGARRLAARLIEEYGTPLPDGSRAGPGVDPDGSRAEGPRAPLPRRLSYSFPPMDKLAGLDPTLLPLTRSRAACLVALAGALASGKIDLGPGADRDEATYRLEELAGIGPWTSSYICMRALGDPDSFLPSDLGVRKALEGMGLDATPASATALAQSWRPWRSYALVHLWARPPAPARRTAAIRRTAATRRTAAIRRTAATRSTATKG